MSSDEEEVSGEEYESVEEEEEVEEEVEEVPVVVVKKKKRKGKKKKDPLKPKRNMSAFFLYSNAFRSEVKVKNPDVTFGEVVSSTPACLARSDAPRNVFVIVVNGVLLLSW